MNTTKFTWRSAAFVVGLLFGMLTATAALAGTVQRPISDFISQQGTFCFPDGSGGCLLFVPPDPNYPGWINSVDSDVVYFAAVDFAGVVLPGTYPPGKSPKLSGSVTERALPDGRAEVTVLLHSKNVLCWVMEIDLAGDVPGQILNRPTVFGHRQADVRAGAKIALANSFLHLRFINTAPGAPLPDAVQLFLLPEPTQQIKFLAFTAQASGPLTVLFGVPEGTPGKAMIVQTGLFGRPAQPLAADAFPAEIINLFAVGK
jgi:hypothetical protein